MPHNFLSSIEQQDCAIIDDATRFYAIIELLLTPWEGNRHDIYDSVNFLWRYILESFNV